LRILTAVLLVAGLGVLALLLKTLIVPDNTQGPGPEGFSSQRVQAVISENTQPAPERASRDTRPKSVAPLKADGPLCDRVFDAGSAKLLSLPDGRAVRNGPETGERPWTWINVWAVWCKPCKEEMPMLSDWAGDVRVRGGALRLIFLSVDDDKRQLDRFIGTAGKGLDGDFVWVEDVHARARFYKDLGFKDDPTLPVHAILDPSGRMRCVHVGTVDKDALLKFSKENLFNR